MSKQILIKKKVQRPNVAPETLEMAQRIACHFGCADHPAKHNFELLIENFELLEQKLRERFYQELWAKGLNGRN